MSCPTKTPDNNIPSDEKLPEELTHSKETPIYKTDNKFSGTPPLPMIPYDDMDDGEEGFPLITSVFSLASDSSLSEHAEFTSSKGTSTVVTVNTSGSCPLNGGNVSVSPVRVLTVDTKPGPTRDNAPYYVGKGKLILPKPKPDESKGSLPKSTMAFSQMVSISPQNNNSIDAVKNTANGGQENSGQATGMVTKSTSIKIGGNTVAVVTAPSYQTQSIPASPTSQPQVVNLANTVQFLNVKNTQGQTSFSALAPLSSSGSTMSSSVLGASSPLVKLIKSISTNNTVPNVNLVPATTVTNSTAAPLATSVAPTPGIVQVRSPRHINIAPAPKVQQISPTTTPVNTTRYVVVPKTAVSTSSTPAATKVVYTKGGVNLPRVVMVPKTASPQGTPTATATPVLYLVENPATGDAAKTYRIFIPERKPVVSPGATPSQTSGTVAIVSTNNGNTIHPTQLVRIIPKPAMTTVANKQSKISLVTQISSSPTILNLNVSKAAPILSANVATTTPTAVTSPTPVDGAMDTESTADKSTSAMSASPASSEEDTSSVESLDAGLSPHEARIQKLKELLRTQEEAVDRLRQKRQKAMEDIRSPTVESSNSDGSASKRDSPFAVPLPPKKARLEHYRNKLKETDTPTKDGFLPNSDDSQFVKLVGLERVVDKLKAKKMQELKESEAF